MSSILQSRKSMFKCKCLINSFLRNHFKKIDMKKILLLLLFIGVSMESQTVNYVASSENFPNPQRGLYKYTIGVSTGTFVPLNAASIAGYRANNSITLVQRNYILDAFRTSPISQDFLNKIQNDFTIMRNSGVKCVLRFAYSDDSDNDATKARIMAHIDQLKTVTIPNQDVISSVSGGFIAQFGEWYNSVNFGTDNLTAQNLLDRKEVGLKIMELAPNRMFAFRTPFIQRLIGGNAPISDATAYDGSINSRIGAHNDCFLSDATDYGTYENTTTDYAYLEQQSKYTFDGGEVCALSSFSDCTNAIFTMNRFHFSYLNFDYNQEVHDFWQANGCFDEIQRRIGYRFEMLNSTILNHVLTINIQNVGFGNLMNQRNAYLVMKSVATGTEYSFLLNTNMHLWLSGSAIRITQSLDFPALPSGSYKLYLNLPDIDLNNVLFSIECANLNTWVPSNGYNDLNQTYSISTLSTTVFIKDNQIIVPDLDNYSIQVYDLTGKLVATNLDVSSLANSVYIVKIITDSMVYTQKIVKR